jgi:uncharacterized caspase-like protein
MRNLNYSIRTYIATFLLLLLALSSAAIAEGFVIKPKLYLLSVGVSDYEDDQLDLQFAAKDASDFATTIQAHSADLYREISVNTLTDPTSDELLAGLDWLRNEVTSKDVAMFFLAGHGVNDHKGNYYFLTKDAEIGRMRRTAIEYHDIRRTLTNLPGTTLLFIDTCHSDSIRKPTQTATDLIPVINDLTNEANRLTVFASAAAAQYSLEDPEWNNGAFTKALIEGLSGKADYTGDGYVTLNQLDLYLAERVKALTGNRQTPITTRPASFEDLTIGVN